MFEVFGSAVFIATDLRQWIYGTDLWRRICGQRIYAAGRRFGLAGRRAGAVNLRVAGTGRLIYHTRRRRYDALPAVGSVSF